VRFARVGTTGLEFELMVFVAQLEDRLVVNNDLNRTLLAKLIEARILDPTPAAEFRLRNLDTLADALRGRSDDHANPSPPR
jgi:small-conductance mechanosensitive channel